MNKTVVIIDVNHEILAYFSDMIHSADGFEVVGTAHDGESGIECVLRLMPHLTILDFHMPLKNGLEAARAIKSKASYAANVFLTEQHRRPYVRAAMESGAIGYVLKSSANEDLLPALHAAMNGQQYISLAVEK